MGTRWGHYTTGLAIICSLRFMASLRADSRWELNENASLRKKKWRRVPWSRNWEKIGRNFRDMKNERGGQIGATDQNDEIVTDTTLCGVAAFHFPWWQRQRRVSPRRFQRAERTGIMKENPQQSITEAKRKSVSSLANKKKEVEITHRNQLFTS